jgi:hypothetical protein
MDLKTIWQRALDVIGRWRHVLNQLIMVAEPLAEKNREVAFAMDVPMVPT